jgi:hypothetical protein
VTEHWCHYDYHLNEPCGKPARFRCEGLWLCAEHWDITVKFLARYGMPAPDRAAKKIDVWPGEDEDLI